MIKEQAIVLRIIEMKTHLEATLYSLHRIKLLHCYHNLTTNILIVFLSTSHYVKNCEYQKTITLMEHIFHSDDPVICDTELKELQHAVAKHLIQNLSTKSRDDRGTGGTVSVLTLTQQREWIRSIHCFGKSLKSFRNVGRLLVSAAK